MHSRARYAWPWPRHRWPHRPIAHRLALLPSCPVLQVRCEESHGLTVGSVWFDDVSNVTYRRCHLSKTKAGPRIKGRSQGNATVRNITFEDITLEGVGVGLEVDMNYETPGSTAKSIGCTAVGVAFRNISGSVTEKAAEWRAGRPAAITVQGPRRHKDTHSRARRCRHPCTGRAATSAPTVLSTPRPACAV